jgi:hypothetical protein
VRILLLLALPCIVSTAFASGGGEIFIPLMAGQALAMLWPLLLPLFFLANVARKSSVFITGLFCTHGALGLAAAPGNWYVQAIMWSETPPEFSASGIALHLAIQHLVALFIAVLALRKVHQHFSMVKPHGT